MTTPIFEHPRPMRQLPLLLCALAIAGPSRADSNCASIQTQIESKIRASGVQQFTLTTLDADAKAGGRVVGTCDRGARKIVYSQSLSPGGPSSSASSTGRRAAATRPGDEAILTECKDGTMSLGGNCRK